MQTYWSKLVKFNGSMLEKVYIPTDLDIVDTNYMLLTVQLYNK